MLLRWSCVTVAFVLAAALLSGCSEDESSFGADQPPVDACLEELEQRHAVPKDGITRSLSVGNRADGWQVRYSVEDRRTGNVASFVCSVARDSSSPTGLGSVIVER